MGEQERKRLNLERGDQKKKTKERTLREEDQREREQRKHKHMAAEMARV